jgi:hypothetical protein
VLIVRVNALAVEGRANVAVIEALAEAFAVKRGEITIAAGLSGRTKIVDVTGGDPTDLARLLQR